LAKNAPPLRYFIHLQATMRAVVVAATHLAFGALIIFEGSEIARQIFLKKK